jgi:hypothetical protein
VASAGASALRRRMSPLSRIDIAQVFPLARRGRGRGYKK